ARRFPAAARAPPAWLRRSPARDSPALPWLPAPALQLFSAPVTPGHPSRASTGRHARPTLADPSHSRGAHAMPRRIIDLSVALQAGIASDPPGGEPKITYIAHDQGAGLICRHFPGLTRDDLPDRQGWAVERC